MPADPKAKKHGTRGSYVKGCRCDLCRQANQAYELLRRQAKPSEGKGYVLAGRAQAHLLALAELGVGYKAVSEATDISRGIIIAIRLGRKVRILSRTERKILAVNGDMALDRALVDAAPTWALVAELQAAGFQLRDIAKELEIPRLETDTPTVTVRRADAIRRVHERLMADAARQAEARAESERRREASLRAVRQGPAPVLADTGYRTLLDVFS